MKMSLSGILSGTVVNPEREVKVSGTQLSDMSVGLWVMFTLALLYDLAYFGAAIWVHLNIRKHPYKSKEWRDWDTFGFFVCVLGMLPFIYINVFLLIPFGFFDLPSP